VSDQTLQNFPYCPIHPLHVISGIAVTVWNNLPLGFPKPEVSNFLVSASYCAALMASPFGSKVIMIGIVVILCVEKKLSKQYETFYRPVSEISQAVFCPDVLIEFNETIFLNKFLILYPVLLMWF